MRAREDRASVVALTAANLLPLAGVLFLGWDAGAIVLLAWSENLIVGFYAVLKIALVKVEKPAHHLAKLFFIAFFCMHFGLFCGVHGSFILYFFKLGGPASPSLGGDWPFPLVFLQILVGVAADAWRARPPGMEWQVLCLFLSHGVSFVQNYVLGKEYASSNIVLAMVRPYGRMVLMHVALIAGAAATVGLGSPVPMLFVLVGLKLAVDVALHRWSHREWGAKGRPGARLDERVARQFLEKGLVGKRLGLGLFCAFLSVFALVSVCFAWHQHHKVTTFRPVDAVVTSSGFKQEADSEGGQTYSPSVVYTYEVSGRSYTSQEVFPIGESFSSRETAARFSDPYGAGQVVQAYYDPKDPSQSFLLKRYCFIPYLFILASAPAAVVVVALCFWDRVALLSRQPAERKALMVAAVWHGVGIAVCGQYFAASVRPYETFPIAVAAIYEGLGVIPLAMALPKRGVWGRLREALFASLVGGLVGLWAGALVGGLGGLAVALVSRAVSGRAVGGLHWALYGLIGGAAAVGLLFGLATLFGKAKFASTPPQTDGRRQAKGRSGRGKGQ